MVATPDAPARRRTLAAALVGAVLLGLVGLLAAPAPTTPGPESSGDPALAGQLREVAGAGQHGVAAVVVDGGTATFAGIGDDGHGEAVTETTPFEIGSVTKTVTGAVLADLERRGVVRADERVRDVVPDRQWRDGGVGDATLAELASHRSGLPRLAGGGLATLPASVLGWNPYGSTPQELFADADAAELSDRGSSRYSNLGSALLGQVLAVRAGTPYPELVRESVTGPLGMTATTIPDAPPPGAAQGHRIDGRAVDPWISAGDAPAGIGVWSTTTDLARYAAALTDPGSPVADAAVPRWPSDIGRIGYAWNVYTADGRTLIWKNGGSGGVSSSVLAEPATGRAVVVLGNSEAGVDDIAARLLDAPPPSAADPAPGAPPEQDAGSGDIVQPLVTFLVGAVFPLWAGASVLAAARTGRRRTPATRAAFVAAVASAVLLLVLARLVGGASLLFVPFWVVGSALAGAGIGLAAVRWAGWESGARSAWAGAAMSGALAAAGLVLAVA